jgi:hypothetical protein
MHPDSKQNNKITKGNIFTVQVLKYERKHASYFKQLPKNAKLLHAIDL